MGETGHVFVVGEHTTLSSSTPSHSLFLHKQHQKPHPVPFSDWSGCDSVSQDMNIIHTHLCVQHAPPQGLLPASLIAAAGTWVSEPPGAQPHSSHQFRAKWSLGSSPWAKPELQAGELRGRMLSWCLGPPRASTVPGYSSPYKGKVNWTIYLKIVKTPKWFFWKCEVLPSHVPLQGAVSLWTCTEFGTRIWQEAPLQTHHECFVSLLSGAGCLWHCALPAWIICSLTTAFFSSHCKPSVSRAE